MLLRKKKQYVVRTAQPLRNKAGFTFSFIHKLLPFGIIITSMNIASQKCARLLNYDENILGKPFFIYRKQPFYHFYSIIQAYISSVGNFNKNANEIVYECSKIIIGGVVFGIVSYYLLVYIRNLNDENDAKFLNSGEWGNLNDLREVGCLADRGVVIGQTFDAVIDATMQGGSCKLDIKKFSQLVMFNMNVCAMILAGSRLGKGVSTVIPTLFSFPYSLITIDPKAENWEITAGYRMTFNYVYKWSPVSKQTLRFNILDEIDGDNAFRDANMIAQILTAPTNPEANADPHWQETAKVLITATILHCKCSDYEDKSLPGVYKYLSSANSDPNDKGDAKKNLLKKMLKAKHCTKQIHAAIESYANQILSAADEEMGSIFSSALESLSIFNDNNVAYTCGASDFCLNDFKYSKIPISWYMTIPFADLDRLKSLLRLNIEFVCRKFSQDATSHGDEVLKNRILFLIDEFPTLGKMETIETFAGILNGYGISFLWICQSKAQIDKLYGQNAPIIEHCRFIWTYAISDENIAEYFSKRVGNQGVIKQNTSQSGNKHEMGMNNISVNSDVTERPLITATEIQNLPPDCLLLTVQGGKSHILKKEAYYSDKRFMDKQRLPKPETREQMLKQCETSRVHSMIKWWENFDNANEENYYAEISESDVEEMQNNQNEEEISSDDSFINSLCKEIYA